MAAFSSAFAHRLMILGFAVAAASRLLSAMMDRVYRGPGATFGFVFRHALFSITFFNVLGLSFFLVRVFIFISPWHCFSSRAILIWPANCQTKRKPKSGGRLSNRSETNDVRSWHGTIGFNTWKESQGADNLVQGADNLVEDSGGLRL
jgi:hypothetical protein